MGGMLETLKNAWKISDLRSKIVFTIIMLVIYRLGAHIPVPSIDVVKFQQLFNGNGEALAGFLDIVSGGAFKKVTIFAMSITPYINSSIIMQLLTVAIPKLEQLQKEGEEGRKKIAQMVRYGTVLLGFIQATGLYFAFKVAVAEPNILTFVTVTLTFTAGTAFLMWLGEQITEYGIGNGISLIIFAGIISRGPFAAVSLWQLYKAGSFGNNVVGIFVVMLIIAVFVILVAGVVWVQQAERRIPVQYAKRVVGRKMYGGQSTHIPIKVNSAGVIPIIFAMSILMFPATIIKMFFSNKKMLIIDILTATNSWYYTLFNALLIIGFTFFYTIMVFNPIEISNNMKKNGGFIPGIRPGKPTSDYIYKVLMRVTWFNAFFLAFITVFPNIMNIFLNINGIWFAGTSLLIMVGVALDTVKQIESQMLMRHYKGFLE